MPADKLLVTFTDRETKVAMVFQSASDIENSLAQEITSEPGIVERLSAKYPRRFAMMIEVSDDLKNLPAIGAADAEFTKNRGAIEQYRELDKLVGRVVNIDARSVASPTAAYRVEAVRSIDSMQYETGFKVQVTCTESIGGSVFGQGFSAVRRGRINIPVAPLPEETKEANVGDGTNKCTEVVPYTKRSLNFVKGLPGAGEKFKNYAGHLNSIFGRPVAGLGRKLGTFSESVGINEFGSSTKAFFNKSKRILFDEPARDLMETLFTVEKGTKVVDIMCPVGDG